jgi:DNA-binding response OmpR family regulator
MAAAILVCEDDSTHRDLIRASLSHGNYKLFEIGDGRRLLGAAQMVDPDLIILDLRLPGSDGIELLEELRADPELSAVPVLVLTGSVQQSDRLAAYAAGADRFLPKPFSPRQLAALVGHLVEHGRPDRLGVSPLEVVES